MSGEFTDWFAYPAARHPFESKLLKSHRAWQHHSVVFKTAFPVSYPEIGTASGEYYEPSIKDAPLVILLHGMGDHSILPCKMLAASLARRGIASFVPYLPIHTKRLSADMKNRYPWFTDDEWAEIYRVSVINVRQIIDWAKSSNAGRPVGILGISYGGFISAITMGIDSRLSAGVLIVMGGNSLKIGQASVKWGPKRGYGLPEDEYRQALAVYEKYLSEVSEKGPENVAPLRPTYLTDPLTYSERLKYRSLYMINARWDEAIPREATLDFWKAAGQPAISWFPTSHATVWMYYPVIRRRIADFFRLSLNHNVAKAK